ncbi:unnamed protein product, partial [Onchocerca flexuosa]|uniref:Uncharacterized protein n=1 Tax=Onchocerca flexuosa TaxID=387005 RepID=A0A183I745_9BILA
MIVYDIIGVVGSLQISHDLDDSIEILVMLIHKQLRLMVHRIDWKFTLK